MITRKIWIDFLPPGLNGPKGLMRMHHQAYRRLKEKTWALMFEALAGVTPYEFTRARITYTRYGIKLMDFDNMGASFKPVGDALVRLGVFADDSPKYITQLILKQTRVASYDTQGIEILIEEVQR